MAASCAVGPGGIVLGPDESDGRGRLIRELGDLRTLIVELEEEELRRATTERELAASEKRYRTIFELSPETIVMIDRTGTVLDINERLHDLLGYAPEEVIGKRLIALPFLTRESKLKATAKFAKRMSGREVGPYELEFVTKDGDHVTGRVQATPIKDDEGRIAGDLVMVSDITARKDAEEHRLHDRRLYKGIADNTRDGLVVIIGGKITYVNDRVKRILGYSKSELEGMSGLDLAPPEEHDRMKSFMGRVLRKGAPPEMLAFWAVCKDGTRRYVQYRYSSLHLSKDENGYLILITDITERKRAEDRLAKSEDRFSTIFHAAPVSLWEEDLSDVMEAVGRVKASGVRDFRSYLEEHPEFVQKAAGMIKVLDVNEATLRMYGARTKEELLGSLYKVFTPESFDVFREELIALERGQTYFEAEAVNKTLQGKRMDIMITLTIPSRTTGFKSLIVGIIDITARKKAEQELKESRALYKTVTESTKDGLVLIREGRMVYANARVCDILGYSHKELMGLSGLDIATPEERPRLMDFMKRIIQDGEPPGELEFWIVRKDGERRCIQYRYSPVTDDERRAGYLVLVTDVTTRKHAEEELNSWLLLEKVIADVSSRFVGVYDMNDAIDATLEDMGTMSGASRAYVFLMSEDGTTINNTNEWCAEGIDSREDALKGVPSSTFPWIIARLRRGEVVDVPDVTKLPPKATKEKRALEEQGVRSLLALPLMVHGTLAGSIGLDNLDEGGEWHEDVLTLLKRTSRVISNALDRRRAEEALIRSERKYRTLVETLPQRVFHKDRDSVYISCNESYARDLGIAPDDIAGRTDLEFFPKALAEKYRADDRRIMDNGRIEELEERYIKDGKEGWVRTVKVPVKDADGNVIGVMGIFADITAQKQAQDDLRREHELLSRVAETTPTAIVVVDRHGHITFANPRAEDVLGLTKDAITQLTYNAPEWKITAIDGSPLPEEKLPFRMVRDSKRSQSEILLAIEWPGGKRVGISADGSPVMDAEGEVEAVVFALKNVPLERTRRRGKKDVDNVPAGKRKGSTRSR